MYFTQLKTTVPTIHSLVPLKRSRSVLIILDLLINLTHYFDYSVKMLITRTLIFFTLLMAKIYESLACLYNSTWTYFIGYKHIIYWVIRVGALRQHITQNQELGVGMYVTVGTDFWSCTSCSSFAKWSKPWLCSAQCLLNVFKFLKTISIHGCSSSPSFLKCSVNK